MNLVKAIEIKKNFQKIHSNEFYKELLEADNLSIEALKAVDKMRHYPFPDEILQLPGETED